MVVGTCKVYMRAEGLTSLKEKRMIRKSLIEKCRHKFNIAIAEIERQDSHVDLVIGFCCVSNETGHANSMIDTVLDYIERQQEAYVTDTAIEIMHI